MVFLNQLGFTDSWFGMVATDIVELDSIIVEVVEDGQTELISLTVVGLGNTTTTKKAKKTVRKENGPGLPFGLR